MRRSGSVTAIASCWVMVAALSAPASALRGTGPTASTRSPIKAAA